MDNKIQKPVIIIPDKSYQRTPEDEKQDQAEREWKKRRNDEALQRFCRDNPDGRVWPRRCR